MPAFAEVEIRQCLLLSEANRAKLALTVELDPEAAALWKNIKAEVVPFLDDLPRPLTVLNYQGLLDTDPLRIATEDHLKDMDKLALMTWAFSARPAPEYGEPIRKFILAWASAFKPTGNPINENKLEAVILGYYLVKPLFTATERTTIEAWMNDIAGKEMAGRSDNNWETKRIYIVGQIGLILGNKTYEDFALERYRSYIQASLRPDGTSVDFEQRDALHYHTSGLDPLLVFAHIIRQFRSGGAGADLYRYQSPSGASLMKSVHFVDAYARGEKTHEEFKNTKVQLDRDRRAAGIEGYREGTFFKPIDAVNMYSLAVGFEPQYSQLVADILKTSARRYPNWITLLSAIDQAESAGLVKPTPKAEVRIGGGVGFRGMLFGFYEGKFDIRGRQ